MVSLVHSFDVFDTCLTRRVAAPSDIFYAVAEKVAARLGLNPSRAWIEDFVAARVNCERKARRRSASEETTLSEIWNCLAEAMGWVGDEALPQLELDAEDQTIIPVPSLLEDVKRSRASGARIIFVSDMYLPAEFIKFQLLKHGFAQKEERLYVSSETGRLKSTGNLFNYILREEAIRSADISHVGDNPLGDYAVPRRLGIAARLVTDARLNRLEKSLVAADKVADPLAASMRAFRLEKQPQQDPICELVSQFVGPFALVFTNWVLRRAQQNGVKRLYFLSRDCQMLGKAARQMASEYGGIDCRYLYVSRQALFLPSVDELTPAGMPWMKRAFEEPTVRSLLAKLELEFEDIEPIVGNPFGPRQGDEPIDSEERWATFWKAITHENVQAIILNNVTMRREQARKYFETEGLFDDLPWALVDLGWFLTCQQSLQKLLRIWGQNVSVRGYYFGLRADRVSPQECGSSEGLFYQPPDDSLENSPAQEIFSKYPALLEHILGCADHPSVHHYGLVEGRVGAQFAKTMGQDAARHAQRIHSIVEEFVTKNKDLARSFEDSQSCQRLLYVLTSEFFKRPSRNSVAAVRHLTASADQNGLHAAPLANPIPFYRAVLSIVPRGGFIHGNRPRDSWWPEGSFVISGRGAQWVLRLAEALRRWRRDLRALLYR